MRVKIGNTWHDTAYEPIMIELTDIEKGLIASMGGEQSNFCCFPEGTPEPEIVEFMGIPTQTIRETPNMQSRLWN